MAYIKILTDDMIHHGFQWKIGLNELQQHPFNNSNGCTTNALYVCRVDNFFKWLTLYKNVKWVAYVTIPVNAQLVDIGDKIKTASVILHEPLILITDFMSMLLAGKRDLNDFGIAWAAQYNRLDIVESFVPHSSDDIIEYAFQTAAFHGSIEIVKYLLEHRINERGDDDARDDNRYAIRVAAKAGHNEIVRYLRNYVDTDTLEYIDNIYYHHHHNKKNVVVVSLKRRRSIRLMSKPLVDYKNKKK